MKNFVAQSTAVVVLKAVVLVVVVFGKVVDAQSCERYDNTTVKLCNDYVDYKIYLPAGPTEWIVRALLYFTAKTTTNSAVFAPRDCQQYLIPFICANVFQKCHLKNYVATSQSVCRIQCEQVNSECATFFQGNNQPKQDCETYQNKNCFNASNERPPPTFPYECGVPFKYDKHADMPCQVSCPAPIVTHTMEESITWFLYVITPITTVIITVFAILQLAKYRYWLVFPKIYIFYCTLTIFLAHVGFLIATGEGGYRHVSCRTETAFAQGDTPKCTAQTWILYFSIWANQVVFAVIATNINVILFNVKISIKLLHLFYHTVLFVPPLVILIVMQSLGRAGYGTGSSPCLFADVDHGPTSILLILFPFTFTQFWGIMMACIALFVVQRRVGWKGIFAQSRLVAWVFIYGSALVSQIVTAWETRIKGSDDSIEYVTCLGQRWLAKQLHPYTYEQLYRENPELYSCDPDLISYNRYFYYFLAAAAPSVFAILMVVFFSSEIYNSFENKSAKPRIISKTSVRNSSLTNGNSSKNSK